MPDQSNFASYTTVDLSILFILIHVMQTVLNMLFLLKVTSKISCGYREIGIRQFDQFYIIQNLMAPNDTLNSIVYNSYLKDDINMQFTLKFSQLNVV